MTPTTVAQQSTITFLAVAIVGGVTSLASSSAIAQPAEGRCLPITPNLVVSETSRSSGAPIFISERPEDAVVAEVIEFFDLENGWDGENGAKPSAGAVTDAVVLVQSFGAKAVRLEPTVHVNGSVLLEVDGGLEGVLTFRGDGFVSYSFRGGKMGRVPVGRTVPPVELAHLI